jgi:hypothetical protein
MRAAAADFVRFPTDLYPVMTGRVRHHGGANETSRRYENTVVFDHVLSPFLFEIYRFVRLSANDPRLRGPLGSRC